MEIEVGKTEIDAEKQKALDEILKAFNEIKFLMNKLEGDLFSSDDDKRSFAAYIAGNFALHSAQILRHIREEIDAKCKENEEKLAAEAAEQGEPQ